MKLPIRIVLLLSVFLFTEFSLKAADSIEFAVSEGLEEFSELVTAEDNCTDEGFYYNVFEEPISPFDHIVSKEYDPHTKYKKKKSKRIVSGYAMKPFLKQIAEPVTANVSYGYNKPYFLHHLHSFLFRLTPF